MTPPEEPENLDAISEDECYDLLARHNLGRIGVVADGQPLIFPVDYSLGDRVIAFRTAPGTKLMRAENQRVAFEIDGYDPATETWWSVLVQGTAYEITEAVDRQSMLARRLPVWPLAPGQREHWVGIHPTEVSGRRFHPATPAKMT
jgi:nitroimidazol reductase NimA-like FMN-containing flavoprotein (pyridoxamine 5'-phosphate oxidase superfamily)